MAGINNHNKSKALYSNTSFTSIEVIKEQTRNGDAELNGPQRKWVIDPFLKKQPSASLEEEVAESPSPLTLFSGFNAVI